MSPAFLQHMKDLWGIPDGPTYRLIFYHWDNRVQGAIVVETLPSGERKTTGVVGDIPTTATPHVFDLNHGVDFSSMSDLLNAAMRPRPEAGDDENGWPLPDVTKQRHKDEFLLAQRLRNLLLKDPMDAADDSHLEIPE